MLPLNIKYIIERLQHFIIRFSLLLIFSNFYSPFFKTKMHYILVLDLMYCKGYALV